jgi:hypothetical protein
MLVKISKRWRSVAARVCLGSAVVLASCINDKGTAPKNGNVTVRTVNASPDAGSVNVMLNSTTAVAGAGFLADTALGVASGSYTFGVNRSGAGAALVTTPVTFSYGSTYDMIVAGTATGASPTVQLIGGINPPPSFDLTSLAAVRLFNAMADTGSVFGSDSVSVYFTDATDKIGNAKLLYLNMPQFGTGTVNGNGSPIYFSVEPGTYHIIVTSYSDTTKIAADSTVTFAAGQIRTIVAGPSKNQASGSIVVIPDSN